MKRNITIDDLFRMKLLNSPEISPDGKRIAFTYKWTELKDNKYYSNIYMAHLENGMVSPFTRGKHNDCYPLWSPGGKFIAFRTDRDKKNGLWLISSEGGEAYPLMTDKGALGEYIWSSDEKFIFYTFRKKDPPAPEAHTSSDPDYKHKEDDEKRPYDIIEDIPYKTKSGAINPKDKFHIYMMEIETGNKTQLTDANYHDGSLALSPDGKKLAFCSNRVENPVLDYENIDIYVLDLETKDLKKITHQWGGKSGLSWSDDGKFIFFTGHHAPRGKGGQADLKLYKIPSEGGDTVLLTENFQGYISNLLIGDTREFDDVVQPPLELGKELLFCASYHGGCYFYKIPSDGGEPERLEEGRHEIIYYSMDKKKENIAVLKGDALSLSEVYHYGKKGETWEAKKITSYNDFIKEETNISEPEETWFTTGEGVKLQGWIIKPPDFQDGKKYPLIHEIHGGPHILYGYTFFHEMHYFASKGYCVLFINPRGSRGYGESFTSPIDGNWGVPDKRDQKEFLDHVISFGYIDSERLFVMGGSYGGYMTNWLVTQTDRYRAAASMRSVSNCTSLFGVSSGCFHFEHTFGGIPWRDYEHYRKHSPLFHVENVKTPIMILHAENDHLTPICEAEQFFVALRYLGKKARFVRFRDETHEMSRGGKPGNRRARLELIQEWFLENSK